MGSTPGQFTPSCVEPAFEVTKRPPVPPNVSLTVVDFGVNEPSAFATKVVSTGAQVFFPVATRIGDALISEVRVPSGFAYVVETGVSNDVISTRCFEDFANKYADNGSGRDVVFAACGGIFDVGAGGFGAVANAGPLTPATSAAVTPTVTTPSSRARSREEDELTNSPRKPRRLKGIPPHQEGPASLDWRQPTTRQSRNATNDT